MQETDVLQFTGDRELKAYIYQQLLDVQPFLADDSQVSVMVQQVEAEDETSTLRKATPAPVATEPVKSEKKKKGRGKKMTTAPEPIVEDQAPQEPAQPSEYLVTVVATFEDGRLETEGQAADIYDAFSQAKDQMVFQLSELQNAMISNQERALQIQTIMSGNYMIH